MSEATGGGCGILDYDCDGTWDVYFVQSGRADAPPDTRQPLDHLYRGGSPRFAEVSERAWITESRYGQGVAIGDFDDDGFDDVFVTNIGPNTLWRNLGDGTFQEVAAWGGQSPRLWSTSAAWADVDSDGDLDLYVGTYVDFDPVTPKICRNAAGERIQCQPTQVEPVPDLFYVNQSDGTFLESSRSLGLFGQGNRALGVVVADLHGDRRPEIYIANDASANFLFAADENGHFVDLAPALGCALDANGRAQGSMGIAIGDFDRNESLDLYVTNFEGEWNTYYANSGGHGFRDATAEVGGIDVTLPWVGFGTVAGDFDLDGYDELIVANGHIDDLGRADVLAMPAQLFTLRMEHWYDIGLNSGSYFQQRHIGRGCSRCDIDADGDDDLIVVNQNAPAAVLRNESARGHWLELQFCGRYSNRRGIGTRVRVTQSSTVRMQELVGGGSYCSSNEPRLRFGWGDSDEPVAITVEWTSGVKQTLSGVAIDQRHLIVEPVTSAAVADNP